MRQVSGSFGAREGAEARARPRRPYPRAVVLLGVITFCAGCWTGLLIAGVKTFGATRVEAKALEKVNQDFNGSTRFQHAMDFRPNAKFGDCKTYAATKRAKLIEAGWARDRLIVWLALDETGAHHAVLVVDKTTVLDNRFEYLSAGRLAGARLLHVGTTLGGAVERHAIDEVFDLLGDIE